MAQADILGGLADGFHPDDSAYLKSITDLGDRMPVVTSQDIHSTHGIKLVNRGCRINSGFYDKLVRHKLTPPLDHCLTVENPVDAKSLAEAARPLLESHPLLNEMMRLASPRDLPALLACVNLVPSLAFKLTVIREQHPELFGHGLRVALISLYLGHRMKLRDEELRQLAAAALFHDVGMVHIDPRFLAPGHRMNATERRHLYAHPVTGYLILKAFPDDYPPAVGVAVLEHHERLDRSGYPRGAPGGQLSRLGQILAVAEVADSRLGQGDGVGRSYAAGLAAILKLNAKKLSFDVAAHLLALAGGGSQSTDDAAAGGRREVLEGLGQVFDNWDQAYRGFTAGQKEPSELMETINERLAVLRFALHDAGVNPAEIDPLCQAGKDDPLVRSEIEAMVEETRWQLQDLIEGLLVRWAGLLSDTRRADEMLAKAWIEEAARVCRFEAFPL